MSGAGKRRGEARRAQAGPDVPVVHVSGSPIYSGDAVRGPGRLSNGSDYYLPGSLLNAEHEPPSPWRAPRRRLLATFLIVLSALQVGVGAIAVAAPSSLPVAAPVVSVDEAHESGHLRVSVRRVALSYRPTSWDLPCGGAVRTCPPPACGVRWCQPVPPVPRGPSVLLI